MIANGSYDSLQDSTTAGTVNLNTFNLTVGDASSTTFDGVISGGAGGILTKAGAGTLTLTSNTSTYSGGSVVNDGVLTITQPNAVGTGRACLRLIT